MADGNGEAPNHFAACEPRQDKFDVRDIEEWAERRLAAVGTGSGNDSKETDTVNVEALRGCLWAVVRPTP